ncbi:MAG: hypothetical protein ACRDH9_02670 [Actinomycetota bacterium]
MAIIVAMLVSMVVVTLGATSVSLAIHNSEASAHDRRRLQSVHAAEAGVNYYFSHLQSSGVNDFECSIGQALTSTPPARFDATISFYDAGGLQLPCPLNGVEPYSALIHSVGTTENAGPSRTMEALVNLVPLPGGPFGEYAIFSEGNPQFNSNVQVFGGEAVQGSVYSNGSVVLSSNSTIYGNIEAQGSVTLNSNAQVKRNVLAGTSVHLNSNASVFQDIIASNSSVSLGSNSRVFGGARAGTTITQGSGATIDGTPVPNAPSAPPEYQSFPQLVFDSTAWQEAGYSVQSFSSCADAKTFMAGIASGNHAVRISGACDLSYSSNEEVSVKGNLAIVSNGSLTMNSNTRFANVGTNHNLYLLFGLGGSGSCNINFNQNSDVGAGLKTVFYTPCAIDMTSNTIVLEGQMFGGSVRFNSSTTLNYEPIGVPGYGETTFDEDILYVREVTPSEA